MKKTIYLLAFLILFSFASTLNAQDKDDTKEWKHFRILANINDDDIFFNLFDDLLIEPIVERYLITVYFQIPTLLNNI